MYKILLSLIPSIIVFVLAITTKNVTKSLIAGILSAALIYTKFNFLKSFFLILDKLRTELFDLSHIYTFSFLILLGVLISMISQTGSIAEYTKIMLKKIKTKKSAERSSIILLILFFIDDYLSNLTVGSIMKPIAEKFDIPKTRLGFFLSTLSASMCLLIPITSWVATVISNLEASGISENISKATYILANPFNIYLCSIPFIFYAISATFTATYVTEQEISFNTGTQTSQLSCPEIKHTSKSINDFIVPIVSLILLTVFFILETGNFYENGIFKAIQSGDTIKSLFLAITIVTLATTIIFKIQSKLATNQIKQCYINGFLLMKSSIILLTLAWIFGNFIKNDLKTGEYIGQMISGNFPLFLFPLLIFIASTAIAASTGSSWGTINIITPIAIPIISSLSSQNFPASPDLINLLYPTVGAILSGCIAGANISPISDATVVSASACDCTAYELFKSRMYYTMPSVIGCIFATILCSLIYKNGYYLSFIISNIFGFIITVILLHISHYYFSNKKSNK